MAETHPGNDLARPFILEARNVAVNFKVEGGSSRL